MTIAVVGATGNTGRAVVKELKALGQNPISVVRNADKAREVLGADAKVAVAELTDKAALEKALAGVDSVFVVTGHNPGMVEQQNNVLEAAQKGGAKYLVRVAGGRAVVGADSPSVVGRGHTAIEERLKGSGIKWTILRPGLFMQNLFGQAASIKDAGKIVGAAAKDLKIAFIDVRDTGAVRRAHPARSRAACRQDLRIHRQAHQLRRHRRHLLVGAGQDGELCTGDDRADRAGVESAQPAGLAVRPHAPDREAHGERQLLDREHQTDRGYRQASADHVQKVRRGF